MKRKSKIPSTEQVKSWEDTATLSEDEKESLKIMKASRVLSSAEKRRLFGPRKTKQISVRIPEEDLEAIKEIAKTNERPYQQLVTIAVQQFLDRLASQVNVKTRKKNEEIFAPIETATMKSEGERSSF